MSVYVRSEEGVALVTISRPEVRNAIDTQTKELLLAAARDLAQDESVGAVVLTGDGDKAFAAGADIAEFATLSAEGARQASWLARKVCEAIEGSPQAWIAAVNGYALGGGCEIALACDIRLAADTAHFGQPEINLGIMPGYGGTQRLPRAVGLGWAKYLCLSGRLIDADTALRIGLVQQVVPVSRLMDEAKKLALDLAAKPPLARRYVKSALYHAQDVDLDAGCEIERDLFALAFTTEDHDEGLRAFLEKREPRFRGR
ncbi:MAG TPA: enoyl-CoA hydratase-related protein [Thermoleophilia bacterium]|nr:enoyl-CoA hydratase-related protein [Thermoleophilia bacterium]